MFRISLDTGNCGLNTPRCPGVIKIGDFEERFECSLGYWMPMKYQAQWLNAVDQLLQGRTRVALVSSITDPTTANFLFWWPIYSIDGSAHFQQQILFREDFPHAFDFESLLESVPVYESVYEEGQKLSEWVTSIEDIRIWRASV
jgi:hypothetical protein